MKKYDFIFKLSFINYILVLIALPYITARTWADIILFLFIFSCIYQITYIFYLRKKENVTFLKSIANYFLYLTYTSDVIVGAMFLDMLLEIGYDSGWEEVGFIFVWLPVFIISSIYQFIYCIIKRKKNKEINKL